MGGVRVCPWEHEMTRPGPVSTLALREPTERAQDKAASALRVSVFPAAQWGPVGAEGKSYGM